MSGRSATALLRAEPTRVDGWPKGGKPRPRGRSQPVLDSLPEGLKPRLRLFLSIDVVSSTALKQQQSAWMPAMLGFYRDFDYFVQAAHDEALRAGGRPVPTPEFWKSNGDELLYTFELATLNQAHEALQIGLSALEQYRRPGAVERLPVKGTAWIGLFPTPNSEVFFRRTPTPWTPGGPQDAILLQSELRDEWYAGQTRDIVRDFVGPSVDTGFRLTAWATPQRLIVSVDLAFLLASTYALDAGPALQPLQLSYGGRDKLRGVIDGAPYPAIWVPVGEPEARPHPADADVLRSQCEAVIEQNYKFITPLFPGEAGADEYDWVPPYMINQIMGCWREEERYREELARAESLAQ